MVQFTDAEKYPMYSFLFHGLFSGAKEIMEGEKGTTHLLIFMWNFTTVVSARLATATTLQSFPALQGIG
jgi:hypothetical protein